MGFVGNYAPCGLPPQIDGMSVIPPAGDGLRPAGAREGEHPPAVERSYRDARRSAKGIVYAVHLIEPHPIW